MLLNFLVMGQNKEYYAFISYKREDEKWAKWLQNKLEHYKFPTNLNGRTDLPKNIRPTFRDVTDLTPGLLAEEIDKALRSSEWLIVVCSPRSAKSPWVCKEAQTFIDLGRADKIIPFVIEGNPFSKDSSTECYPEALLNLTDDKELLAANINEMGRNAALIKVVGRMFNLRFDTLWQRFSKEQKNKNLRWFALLLTFLVIAVGIAGILIQKDWNMMKIQSRAIIGKANSLVEQGDSYTSKLLMLEVLPKDWFWKYWPNRPFIPEIADAIRNCTENQSAVFHAGRIATISPDDKMIAAATMEGEIIIYRVDDGMIIYRSDQLISTNSYQSINSLVFSPNSNLLAYNIDKELTIINVHSGKIVYKKESDQIPDTFFSLSFSPDGSFIAIGKEAGEIEILDIKNGETYAYISVPHADDDCIVNYVRSVQFSPNGNYLACGTVDGRIRIFDIIESKLKVSYKGHSDQVVSIAYSPNGNYLVSNSWDNHICIYNIEAWKIENIVCANNIYGDSGRDISYHPSGEYFVTTSTDNSIIIWDNEGNKLNTITEHSKSINSVDYSSDGKLLITASDDNTIRVQDVSNPLLWNKEQMRHSHNVSKISFSPDDKMILSSSHDGTTKVWDTNRGILLKTFFDIETWVRSARFSHDGRLVATASDDSIIRIWDIESETCVRHLKGHEDYVFDIAFSSDDKYIASASADNSIKLWDIKCGSEIMTYNGHEGTVYEIAFNKDNTLMFSSSGDSTLRVWNVKTGLCIKVLTGHDDRIRDFAVDYSNDLIATSDGYNVRIWDLNTFECLKIFAGGWNVAFSGNNKFSYCLPDNSICILDCVTWECIRIIKNKTDIQSIAFNSNGSLIVTSSDEGTIQIWNTNSLEDIIQETRDRFEKRSLTLEERRLYDLE